MSLPEFFFFCLCAFFTFYFLPLLSLYSFLFHLFIFIESKTFDSTGSFFQFPAEDTVAVISVQSQALIQSSNQCCYPFPSRANHRDFLAVLNEYLSKVIWKGVCFDEANAWALSDVNRAHDCLSTLLIVFIFHTVFFWLRHLVTMTSHK